MRKVIKYFLIISIASSCGVSQKDFDELKKENEKLKSELDEIKNGPERLLSEAKTFIEQDNLSGARLILHTLIEKHPTTAQAINAKTSLTDLEAKIEKERIEKEKAYKQKQEAEEKERIEMKKKRRKDFLTL